MSKKEKDKEKGANAIHEAIRRGELATVKKLLRKSSTPLNNPVTLQTPLHIAATEGKLDILVYLLEKKKVDIDARDKDGWTPLHCACHSGHLEIVDQLIANGASLNFKTANQSLPLHYFVRMGAQTTRPALYERLFRTMLQKGAEVNTQNLQGDTPLHMAAFRGREKSVSLLLWNNADPNLRNKYGETCLHLAVRAGYIGIVKHLLKAKADMSLCGSEGTPLQLAEKLDHKEIVRILEQEEQKRAGLTVSSSSLDSSLSLSLSSSSSGQPLTPPTSLDENNARQEARPPTHLPTHTTIFSGTSNGAHAPLGSSMGGNLLASSSSSLSSPTATPPLSMSSSTGSGHARTPSTQLAGSTSFSGAPVPQYEPLVSSTGDTLSHPAQSQWPPSAYPFPTPYGGPPSYHVPPGVYPPGSFVAPPGAYPPGMVLPPYAYPPGYAPQTIGNGGLPNGFLPPGMPPPFAMPMMSTDELRALYGGGGATGTTLVSSADLTGVAPPTNTNTNTNTSPGAATQPPALTVATPGGTIGATGATIHTATTLGVTMTNLPPHIAPSQHQHYQQTQHGQTQQLQQQQPPPTQQPPHKHHPQPQPQQQQPPPTSMKVGPTATVFLSPSQEISRSLSDCSESTDGYSGDFGSSLSNASSSMTGSIGSGMKPSGARPQRSSKQPKRNIPVLENYTVGQLLGKGAFGAVYQGLDMKTGAMVAIKQVSLKGICDKDLSAIMAEVNLLKRLDHPNIVKYLGVIRTPDHLNFILEYVEGGSLLSVVKKFGEVQEVLAVRYVAQTLQGLDYLHRRGVIHRDIKCANILITKDGVVKLADFGIATMPDGAEGEGTLKTLRTIRDGSVNANEGNKDPVGSPYWMAPEIILMQGACTASDIWSLGCTIIELVTGDPPFSEMSPMSALFAFVQNDRPPMPEGISAELRDLLERCLQKNPDIRATAKQLLTHPWITGQTIEEARAQGNSMFLAPPPASVTETPTDSASSRRESTTEDEDEDVDDDDDEEEDEQEAVFQRALREANEALSWFEKAMVAGNPKHVIKLRSNLKQKLKQLRTEYREREEARAIRKKGCLLMRECEEKFSDHFQYKSDDDDEDQVDSCDEGGSDDDEDAFQF